MVKKILHAQRRSFNTANRARIEPGRTIIYDINKDGFVIEGLSYGDPNLIELLQGLGARSIRCSSNPLAGMNRCLASTR